MNDLLIALKVLRERHQIDAPHHADLCEYCKQADAAIKKAENLQAVPRKRYVRAEPEEYIQPGKSYPKPGVTVHRIGK